MGREVQGEQKSRDSKERDGGNIKIDRELGEGEWGSEHMHKAGRWEGEAVGLRLDKRPKLSCDEHPCPSQCKKFSFHCANVFTGPANILNAGSR